MASVYIKAGGQYSLGYSVRVGGQFHCLGYIVRGDNIRGDNIYYDTGMELDFNNNRKAPPISTEKGVAHYVMSL